MIILFFIFFCFTGYASEQKITLFCSDGHGDMSLKIAHESLLTLNTVDVFKNAEFVKNQYDDTNTGDEFYQIHLPISKAEVRLVLPFLQILEIAKQNISLAEQLLAEQFKIIEMPSLCNLIETISKLDVPALKTCAIEALSIVVRERYAESFSENPNAVLELFQRNHMTPSMTGYSKPFLNPDLCSDLAHFLAIGSGIKHAYFSKKITGSNFFWGVPPQEMKFSSEVVSFKGKNRIASLDKNHKSIILIDSSGVFHDSIESDVEISACTRLERDQLLYATSDGQVHLWQDFSNQVLTYNQNKNSISLLAAAHNAPAIFMYSEADRSIAFLCKGIGCLSDYGNRLTLARGVEVLGASVSSQGTHCAVITERDTKPGYEKISFYSCQNARFCDSTEMQSTLPTLLSHHPQNDAQYIITQNNHKKISLIDIERRLYTCRFSRFSDRVKCLQWSPGGTMFASIEKRNNSDTISFWDPRMSYCVYESSPGIKVKNFVWDSDERYGLFFSKNEDDMHTLNRLDMRMLTRVLGKPEKSFLDQLNAVKSLDVALLLTGIEHTLDHNKRITFNDDLRKIYDSMDRNLKKNVQDLICPDN